MDNKEFSQILEKRTKKFAVDTIRLSSGIRNTSETLIIKKQITRSSGSIGANYREANSSRSTADFKNKIRICESEASETQYWLEIIQELNWANGDQINCLIKEAGELLALYTSIGNKLRKNNN